MELVRKLDDYGKPAWITLMVLSFIVFWPIGLAVLFFLIGSGRMACWKHGGPGRWYYGEQDEGRRGRRRRRHGRGRDESSGNLAFDEYREETLRRLEEEQQEFQEFLERLRRAKDKAEFDAFMEDRKSRGGRPEAESGDDAPGPGRPMGGGPAPGGVAGGPMPQPMG
jgi:hypothetical protein